MIVRLRRASRRAKLTAAAFVGAVALAALAFAISARYGVVGDAGAVAPGCAHGPLPIVRIAHASRFKAEPGRSELPVELFSDATLVRMGRNGIFNPGLASRWQTSDRRVWAFTLRDHLRSQEGVPLNASTIARAMRAAIAPAGSEPIGRDLRRIDSPSPNTLIFELARPSSAFLEGLAMMPIAAISSQPALHAGPFRLVRQTDREVIYAPFAETWTGQPTIGGVRIDLFQTPRAAWEALLRNEADVLGDVPLEATRMLAQNPDVRMVANNANLLFTLGFRVSHPLLRDPRVRQALNLAINRQAIVDRFFGEYSKPANGPFSDEYPAGADLEDPWPYDPAKARALLKAAIGAWPKSAELICLTSNQLPTPAGIAAMLVAQLEQVNVRIRLVGVTLDELASRMAKGDFDLFAVPMSAGPTTYWPYALWHSSPYPMVDSGYTGADAELDALYTAASSLSEAAAAVAVRQAMRRDPPAAFIAPVPNLNAVRRRWRIPDDDPDIVRSMPRWTLMEPDGCEPH